MNKNKKFLTLMLVLTLMLGCFSENSADKNNTNYEEIDISSVSINNKYLFSLDQYDGLIVYEKLLENKMEIIRRYNNIKGYKIKVEGDYIYISNEKNFSIYNGKNPENIELIFESNFEKKIHGFLVEENRVYLVNRYYSLEYTNEICGDLIIIDSTDKSNIVINKTINTFDLPRESYGTILDIEVTNSNIYIAQAYNSILVFDKNGNYEKELKLKTEDDTEEFHSIKIKDNIMYLGMRNVLKSFDIKDLDDVIFLKTIETEKTVYKLFFHENHLYLTSRYFGTNVIELNTMDLSENFLIAESDFCIDGNYLYLADKSRGVKVFDISEIDAIKEMGNILN